MPIANDFMAILELEWDINFIQCYPNQELKITELCNLLQLTAGKHAELGGISYLDLQEYHQAWVLGKMRVEVEKMPKWRDKVTIKTWINSLENSRSVRCLEVYQNGEKIIGCETFWAIINTLTRKPEGLALPHEHFEKFPKKATRQSFSRLDITGDFSPIEQRVVRLSDLDIVNHANNVKYVEWCLDTMEPKKVTEGRLKAFEMNFMKEVGWGDTIHISQKTGEKEMLFTVSCSDKNCFALSLSF